MYRDKESEREARIQERRQEQDRKRDELKVIKKAARERVRIEQGKKGWWKDFDWVVGVMVEMECDGEWWDAIVVQIIPPKTALPATKGEEGCETLEVASSIDLKCNPTWKARDGDPRAVNDSEHGAFPHDPKDPADDVERWEAAVGYTEKKFQGPSITYPKDWPADGVYICNEDDRPLDIARKHRVNLERLVRNNKKAYPSLTKTSALKAGTAIKLPLPLDIQIRKSPSPPADPLGIGVVLIHYVGGEENETEWVFRCSKRMRPSADKLWNAVAVEAAEEMVSVLAPDPGAWKKHCSRVLKRIRKNDKSWPFWESVDPVKEGLDDYLDIIKRPMCLDSVESSLNADLYKEATDFAEDMRLIFVNAMTYNPPEHTYHQHAKKMLDLFNELWASGHAGNNWGQPYGAASGEVVSTLRDATPVTPSPSVRKKCKKVAAEKETLTTGEKGRDSGTAKIEKCEISHQKEGGEKEPNFMDRRLSRTSKLHIKVFAKF